ncbi:hypothetical protein CABS01_14982, partial [Colletotrichum abscissum]|uniref:uncharacterized protein n=1 Tax=Colletotrichum abscissum TaxID=1671311 RepID=UPI0027D73CEB
SKLERGVSRQCQDPSFWNSSVLDLLDCRRTGSGTHLQLKEPNRSGQPVPELVKMVVRETPVKLLARKSRPRRQPLLCSCKFWATRIGAHLESSRSRRA